MTASPALRGHAQLVRPAAVAHPAAAHPASTHPAGVAGPASGGQSSAAAAAGAEAFRPAVTAHGNGTTPTEHRARPAGHRVSPRDSATGPDLLPPVLGPALSPLRDLGRTLTAVTGWSPFSGPIGWLLSGLSLLAAMMILLALVTGRSGGRFRRSVSGG